MSGLRDDELDLWHAWKWAADGVRSAVAADIADATGLSDPDFGVLTRLVDLGAGRVRQAELAGSMGWHRSRLSHHLSRMEQRGLLTRRTADGGVDVDITTKGRVAVGRARPVHAAAVRRHLLDHVATDDGVALRRVLERVRGSDRETPFPG